MNSKKKIISEYIAMSCKIISKNVFKFFFIDPPLSSLHIITKTKKNQ